MAGTPIAIIVGLGNPGPEHRRTRHNVGFWFVDRLAEAQGAQFRSHSRYQGEVCRVSLEGRDLVLLKPQTYMNRSGLSVRALLDYLKAPVRQTLIVHDDLDLPPGAARFKLDGGHGGHNGLRDTIRHCGTDFWRLRIGIGHPGDRSQVIDYVLQRADSDDEDEILQAVGAGLEALPVFLSEGSEKAMKQLHTKGSEPGTGDRA